MPQALTINKTTTKEFDYYLFVASRGASTLIYDALRPLVPRETIKRRSCEAMLFICFASCISLVSVTFFSTTLSYRQVQAQPDGQPGEFRAWSGNWRLSSLLPAEGRLGRGLRLGTLCCLSFIPFIIKNHLPLDLHWCPACLDL